MPSTKVPLGEQMLLAQQGDNQAYRQVLEASTRIVRGYLSCKLGRPEDVEDVLQEILISVHNARHTYDVSRPFEPWLLSIAKFRLFDFFRKVYRKADFEDTFEESHENLLVANVTKDDDQYEQLHKALETLPEKQRKIVELMKIQGYTAKEVAKKMRMSESAVKVAAHRTYKLLKEKLEAVE